MLGYHFAAALRSILHQKLYTLVGLTSLSLGMTVSILILSFVNYEEGFDAMHFDNERIYRLNWVSGDGSHFATFNNPLSPMLATALPEIESFARIGMRQHLFTVEGEDLYRSLSFVDSDFFDFFNYEALAGDPSSSITDMKSAVITESAALELFGDIKSIGAVFTVDGIHDFRVAAIIGDNPGNSHLVSNIYVNIENLPTLWNRPTVLTYLYSDVLYHYIKLAPKTSAQAVVDNATAFLKENVSELSSLKILLQPLRDIHFTADLQNEMSTRDDVSGLVKPLRQRSDITVFSVVGFLVLLIAALNFMNLQAVRLTKRAREIGIRRIAGASPFNLATAFLIETAIVSSLALMVSLALCSVFLPYFNSIVGANILPEVFFSFGNLWPLIVVSLFIAILAGAYPAITAARLAPTNALRGEVVKGVTADRFRSALIVAQFSISIGLIVASAIVNTQINYAMSKSLGFDPQNVLTIELPNQAARAAYPVLRAQLLNNSGVISVSAGSIIPTRDLSDGAEIIREGGDPNQPLLTRVVTVSEDYIDVLGMKLVAGRALSDDFATDRASSYSDSVTTVHSAVVLNETAANLAGWENPQDAIGESFYAERMSQDILYRRNITVVGVVQDAHFRSVRTDIAPISFTLDSNLNVITVKLAEGNQTDTLAEIDQLWQQNLPELPIQRSYLSNSYAMFYLGESRTFGLFIGLSVIAILIACFGLYAVTSFIVERRTKEIGIRKVLGATVRNITGLLIWDFSKLVILANLIAWPLAWWLMQQWLANFAYRTDISITLFFFAGIATFFLALATTFQRTYRVAISNPIMALRTE